MRSLSEQERTVLQKRKANFEGFFAEIGPVLCDFFESLRVPDAEMVIAHPSQFVSILDAFMKDQTIEEKDYIWIMTRLGYFIGEWLVQRFGGCWFVVEDPDSRLFARYAVGRFSHCSRENAAIDPMEVANAFLSEPRGRSLEVMLRNLVTELEEENGEKR